MIPHIILAIENPDEREFMTQLYTSYKRLMYSEISKITQNSWDTEDVLHSVIVKLINKVNYLQTLPRSRLVNYIISAAKNTALNHIRDNKRHNINSLEDEYTDIEDLSPPLDDILHLKELKGDVTTALRSLDEKSQRILEMKYMLDLSNAEIADELQISVDSLRMSLTRARRKLKSAIEHLCTS